MRASPSLGGLCLGRPHPLSGSREGQYGIGLSGNFRLVVEIAMETVPVRDDGTVDLLAVTDIRVLEVVDYHG
jgi:proteic killer suppression protein